MPDHCPITGDELLDQLLDQVDELLNLPNDFDDDD